MSTLLNIWGTIQRQLFPTLEEEIGAYQVYTLFALLLQSALQDKFFTSFADAIEWLSDVKC